MKIRDLVNVDACTAIDWLIENQYDYEIVPKNPTKSMSATVNESKLNDILPNAKEETKQELAKDLYKVMINKVQT